MTTNQYDPKIIEAKWTKVWEEKKIYQVDVKTAKRPFYNLAMFPYPSGEGLHVGHIVPYSGVDTFGRYKKMKGFDVFEPMGFDSFGIHSENFAIKQGMHPKELTRETISYFRDKQMKRLGTLFDWSKQVATSDQDYYKWTQWIFVQMFKHGLAEKKTSFVTYCPSCKTVLSDEQTETKEGVVVCERCKTPIEQKEMKQWFFKITKYAERLLSNLSKIDWSERTKLAQKNWIGKSNGALVDFDLERLDKIIPVFTTRPDTLFGVTFMVVAPEHPILDELPIDQEVKEYIKRASTKTEQERIAEGKNKTGVFSGFYAINPVNKEKIPVWVADYVVMGCGTGAIMAVPAHDKRDFDFAKKYELSIKEVIAGGDIIKEAYHGEGKLVNSNDWNGWDMPRDIDKVIKWLEEKKIGERKTTYKLRDWCISRQRYWGPPIPMVYCFDCMRNGITYLDLLINSHSEAQPKNLAKRKNINDADAGSFSRQGGIRMTDKKGMTINKENFQDMPGWFPVSEEDLPVLLPETKDYLPDGSGKSPLAKIPEFVHTKCPYCGGKADRETDVSDTFLDSSWYHLRYPSVGLDNNDEFCCSEGNGSCQKLVPSDVLARKNSLRALDGTPSASATHNCNPLLPWDFEVTKKWLPVDMYIGGQEHACLHLMYARFVAMALNDMGYLDFDEPYTRFFAHGLMIKEGAKMSKSRGNVVNPVKYLDLYGSDCLRMYVLFMGPYDQKMDFRDSGIDGMYRFLGRVWNFVQEMKDTNNPKEDQIVLQLLHKMTKTIGEDIEQLHFNTSIAHLMEILNAFSDKKEGVSLSMVKHYLALLAPFAPFISEELWQVVTGPVADFPPASARKKSSALSGAFPSAPPVNNKWSIHQQSWPEYDEKYLQEETVTIVVQVNGKLRGQFTVNTKQSTVKEEMERVAGENEKVKKYIEGKKVVKTVFVPGKIVNFVVEK